MLIRILLLTVLASLGLALAQNSGVNPSSRASDGPLLQMANDRYFVEFQRFLPAAVEAAGGRVIRSFPALNLVAARLTPQAYRALANNPDVRSIEEDPRRFPQALSFFDSVVSGETVPYGIQMVQADRITTGNAGSRKVCIIDSGYHRDHEDLQYSNVDGSPDSGTGDWFVDNDGHGTHVAGTIVGLQNAKGVRGVLGGGNLNIHIVKVFGDDGNWAYSSSLIAALDKCRAAGANVVSMSLGGSTSSRFEQSAFNSAYSAGVLSIAAAGNDGTSRKSYPASYSSVVSVGAVDNKGVIAPFSQFNDAVELVAPGVAVLSTVPYAEVVKVSAGTVSVTGNHVEFAARTTAAGVTGQLVDGGLCTAANSGWSGRVVLCARGEVSFTSKVQNVQTSGGLAAVIYNNEAGELYATLGTGNTSTIPAIGVTSEAGSSLKTVLGASSTVISTSTKPASGYTKYDGTSMATPHVSGVAALIWSHNPGWTNVQIREAMQSTAIDLGAAGKDNYFGYGLVQAQAALTALGVSGGGSGDTVAPAISSVSSAVTSKNGTFQITWTTNEPANSTVTFTGGSTATSTSSALVTSHKITFKGTRGVLYTYTVSSKDAAGNVVQSGPHTHQN